MKLSKFNYLFNDISYYLNENENLFDKLNTKIDFENEYLKPFKEELNKNILETFNKVDTIKFYLFELFQLQNQFKNNDAKLLFQTPLKNKDYTKYENYILISHYLYDAMLTEIQINCLKYDIDFFLLCENLNIDCTLFDCGVAMAQENKTTTITIKTKKTESNFNNFLDNVRTGNVSNIEIENYIYKISKKHKNDKLETLLKDIEFYLFVESDLMNSKITRNDWDKIHLHYQNKGETIPFERIENTIQKALDKKNNTLSNEPDFYFRNDYDLEKLFYPHEFFCIYQLKNYIKTLILPTPNNINHNNIFSNNGFILFNHILNKYVKPKHKRGRFSDISFYYWKMYNSEIQYIHQRPEAFKKWFFENNDKEDIGKIKTLSNLKDINRNKHYSTALEWFKSQNK